MTTRELLILYLVGFAGSLYVGMRVEAWRWAKRFENDIQRVYDRGFKAGRDFNDRIIRQRLDLESSVRILTGEDAADEQSFTSS